MIIGKSIIEDLLLIIISIVIICGLTYFLSDPDLEVKKKNLVCIDDVEYIVFSRGYKGYSVPHFKKDGLTVHTCGEN